MTTANTWRDALAQTEQERDDLDRAYRQKRDELDVIIKFLKGKVGQESLPVDTAPSADGPYAGVKILDAAEAYLREQWRAMRAPEIAKALLAGGMQTRGDEANFPTSVYNTLKKEADKENGRVVQQADKSFVVRGFNPFLPKRSPFEPIALEPPSEQSPNGAQA